MSPPDCKAISQIYPIFHCYWSSKYNSKQHFSVKRGPTTSNLTACCLGTLATECFISCMQTAKKKNASKRCNTSNFRTTPSLEFNATPNAYQLLPVSVQQPDTQIDTSAPQQFEGDTKLSETGINPGRNFSKPTVQYKPGSLEQPHSPWNFPF